MPAARYRCTWDDIAALDCDHIASWGAFDPGRLETVDFDNDRLPRLAYAMAETGSHFRVSYVWPGAPDHAPPIHARVELIRRPCRFGGTRAYFKCPICHRAVLRLAVLSQGLRCGRCGRVTWASRRERPAARAVRKAERIASKLGCARWYDPPTVRPRYMREATFSELMAKRATAVAAVQTHVARTMRRSGLLATMATIAKAAR